MPRQMRSTSRATAPHRTSESRLESSRRIEPRRRTDIHGGHRPGPHRDGLHMATEIGSTEEQAQALAARLFTAALGTMDLFHIYIGQQLGLYARLSSDGAL